MFDEYKYKIEMHCHTNPVSSCSDIPPELMVSLYKKEGYDAIVITNHIHQNFRTGHGNKEEAINWYLDDYRRAVKEGEKQGLKVILGAEPRFINYNDCLCYGIDENTIGVFYDYIHTTVENFREKYHDEKLFFAQAHPFRDDIERVPVELLDGVEAMNLHADHNSRIADNLMYATRNNLIPVAGSDCHHEWHVGGIAMMAKTLPKDSFELADIIRSKDYIFDMHGFKILPPFISKKQ